MAISAKGVLRNNEKKEIKLHGTAEFPCAGYEYEMSENPDDEVPWHYHDEIEAVYISDGKMSLKVISKQVELGKGELALINSDALHCAKAVSHCKLQSLVFSKLLVEGNSESVFAKKYIEPLCSCEKFTCLKFSAESKEICGYCDAFEMLKNDAQGFEFAVRNKLSEIVMSAFLHFHNEIKNSAPERNNDAKRIAKMIDFIKANFAEDINLSDISTAADIGEREALRCFKRTIGESPMQYLLRHRLQNSADLIKENSGEKIAVIAGKCGFNSPSYFTKKFHELYKLTPSEYFNLNFYSKCD